jgi:hypothetical protein
VGQAEKIAEDAVEIGAHPARLILHEAPPSPPNGSGFSCTKQR